MMTPKTQPTRKCDNMNPTTMGTGRNQPSSHDVFSVTNHISYGMAQFAKVYNLEGRVLIVAACNSIWNPNEYGKG